MSEGGVWCWAIKVGLGINSLVHFFTAKHDFAAVSDWQLRGLRQFFLPLPLVHSLERMHEHAPTAGRGRRG